jgi:hypothetical protein
MGGVVRGEYRSVAEAGWAAATVVSWAFGASGMAGGTEPPADDNAMHSFTGSRSGRTTAAAITGMRTALAGSPSSCSCSRLSADTAGRAPESATPEAVLPAAACTSSPAGSAASRKGANASHQDTSICPSPDGAGEAWPPDASVVDGGTSAAPHNAGESAASRLVPEKVTPAPMQMERHWQVARVQGVRQKQRVKNLADGGLRQKIALAPNGSSWLSSAPVSAFPGI